MNRILNFYHRFFNFSFVHCRHIRLQKTKAFWSFPVYPYAQSRCSSHESRVTRTCRRVLFLLHFHICLLVVILSLRQDSATRLRYMPPCVYRTRICPRCYVFRDMFLRHDSSCGPTLKLIINFKRKIGLV